LIRVWGGGLLEPDYFYHCCNERGIMVWQDFPMGNANHDSWPQDVWQATAAMNIYRLRNHPSLAIYCGGNEFNPYSLGNSTMMGILEGLITDLDGSRLFMRSTPDRGSEHTYPDMDPTWYQYEYSLVPYMAETGIHNFADAKTIREEVSADELNKPITGIFKESFKDRYPEFFYHFTEYSPSRIPRMLSRASQIVDISEPMVEDLTQASQVGAGEFYQIFSEILQANYPVTTGLMPWVFKRPWTLVAIQTVDATGQPTAPYYFLKRTYEPTHVMVQLSHLMWAKNESIPITAKILHEEHYPLYNLQVHVSIYDKKFAPVKTFKENVDVNTGPSVTTLQLGEFGIPSYFEESFFYIMAELKDQNNKRLSRSVYWPRCLERMNDQQYRQEYRSEPQPALTFDKGPWLKDQVAETSTELELELISTEKRQKDRRRVNVRVRNQGKSPAWPVRFDIDGIKRSFYANDNYFWLAPGEEKEIEINVLLREPETGKSMSVTVETWNADKVVKSIE
jgi:beta-mannosidase